MAVKETKRVSVKSILNGTLIHNGIEVAPLEVLSVTEDLAKELIATGYVKEVKVKEV